MVTGLTVCRRSAERRFRAVVGRGIAAELRRTRIEHANELLAETGLSVSEVSERAGFPTPERFAVAFRREARTTPTAYRAQVGRSGPAGRPTGSPLMRW